MAQYRLLPGALPLSRRLPFRGGEFDDTATWAFFANLLPEGDIRRQVARQLGVSAKNVFALLEGIGGDCAGAVSIHRPGDTPGKSGSYRAISPEVLAQELATLPMHPFLVGEEGVRWWKRWGFKFTSGKASLPARTSTRRLRSRFIHFSAPSNRERSSSTNTLP